jgi:topoisomerase IA-like protein
LPKDHPPESFSLEEAIALLEAKGGKVVVKATPKAKAKATPKATPKPRVRAKKTA